MAMVSCPKCGFTQPADQYCANCGVDMKAWKPREKPFFIRVATNSVFQIVIVTVIVMVTFVYMRENRKRELAAHVRAIEIARQAEEVDEAVGEQYQPRKTRAQTTSASESSNANQASLPQAAQPAPAPGSNTRVAALVGEGTSTSSPAGGSAPGQTSGATTAGSSKAPTSITLTYYEVSRGVIAGAMQTAQQGTSEGPLTIAVVTGLQDRMGKAAARELDAVTQNIQVNQPAIIFKGARSQSTGANIGFTVQVNPVALTDEGAQIQVDIARVLPSPEAAGGVDEATFAPSETFALAKGSSLLISGLLPHKTPTDAEANFFKTVNVLRPMTSPPHQLSQSETVLVIEAK